MPHLTRPRPRYAHLPAPARPAAALPPQQALAHPVPARLRAPAAILQHPLRPLRRHQVPPQAPPAAILQFRLRPRHRYQVPLRARRQHQLLPRAPAAILPPPLRPLRRHQVPLRAPVVIL